MKNQIIYFFLFVVTFIFLNSETMAKEANGYLNKDGHPIFKFDKADEMEYWRIVNDGVMGGLSQSQIIYSDSKTAIFKGTVSLDNNGGFASTRTTPISYELGGYNGIRIRVKGDGKKYQFRLRTNNRFDGISYRYEFTTKANTWITVDVPFHKCVPVFRGRILEDVEPILSKEIQQIGFLISNKQAEKFQIEIDWIKAYK